MGSKAGGFSFFAPVGVDVGRGTDVSGAAGSGGDAQVSWGNAVMPAGGNRGFGYPTEGTDRGSKERFGPNCTCTEGFICADGCECGDTAAWP